MKSKEIALLVFILLIGIIPEMSSQGIMIYKTDGSKIKVPYTQLDSIVPYEVDTMQTQGVPEAVDLGLPSGTKWASYNIGATKPEEYGDYYAWGEINTKEEYTKQNYVHFDQSKNSFINIGTTISSSGYDVAYMTWGDGWRMPTKAEFEELVDCCFWTWTTLNGVNGYKVESYNGNSIFLPAAGMRYESSLKDDGKYGQYWSGTIKENSSNYSTNLFFHSSKHAVDYSNRFNGNSIRPVKK